MPRKRANTIPPSLENFDRLPDSANVRLSTVIGITGLSKSSIYRMEREGRFPSKINIGLSGIGWNVGALRRYLRSRGAAA